MRVWIAAAVAFAVGATVASAAQPWRVFATGTDSSDYGAYANASADAPHSSALAIRASSRPGKTVSVSVSVFCSMDANVRSGAVVVLATPRFKKCSVNAAANTDYSGRVRVELLRRP